VVLVPALAILTCAFPFCSFWVLLLLPKELKIKHGDLNLVFFIVNVHRRDYRADLQDFSKDYRVSSASER